MAQNKILQIITFSGYRESAQPLFVMLNLMTVDQLYKYHTVIFMYKYTTKQLPNNFK